MVEESEELAKLEFIYKVATMAWKEGLSANTIAARLKEPKKPKDIMKVKRALGKAVNLGVLTLRPAPSIGIQKAINDCFPNTHTTVVENRFSEVIVDPVSVVAAQKIVELVTDRLKRARQENRPVHVANTGGATIAQAIRTFNSDEHKIANKRDLVFLAANNAGYADNFDSSASFLAVRMSEVFGGAHFAVPPSENSKDYERYDNAISNIDLLIASAGTLDQGLLAHRLSEEGASPPSDAVGDYAFHPMRQNGDLAQDDNEHYLRIAEKLKVRPTFDELEKMRRKSKTLVILHSHDSLAKLRIGYAILLSGLATECVCGAILGNAIVQKHEQAGGLGA